MNVLKEKDIINKTTLNELQEMNTVYKSCLDEIKNKFKIKEDLLLSKISRGNLDKSEIENSKECQDKTRNKQMMIVIDDLRRNNKILSFKLEELTVLLNNKERELSEIKKILDSNNSSSFKKNNELLDSKFSFYNKSYLYLKKV